jgi:CheY-like chemotaxis protein
MLRIMLVEDDPDVAFVLQELLEAEGHVVVLAIHGKQALDTALMLSPELIITGMMMPYMNGVEMLRKLRESGYMGRTILCSSLSEDDFPDGEDLYDAFIRKPFLAQQLLDAISRVRATPAPIHGVNATRLMESNEKPGVLHGDQETDESAL